MLESPVMLLSRNNVHRSGSVCVLFGCQEMSGISCLICNHGDTWKHAKMIRPWTRARNKLHSTFIWTSLIPPAKDAVLRWALILRRPCHSFAVLFSSLSPSFTFILLLFFFFSINSCSATSTLCSTFLFPFILHLQLHPLSGRHSLSFSPFSDQSHLFLSSLFHHHVSLPRFPSQYMFFPPFRTFSFVRTSRCWRRMRR